MVKKDYNSQYYSERIPRILQSQGRIERANKIFAVIKDFLEKKNTKTLTCLDIGCASGIITNELAKKFKKVIGIEVDKPALEIAKKNFVKKNLSFLYMSAEKLIFKNNSFDVVICHQVYNCVEHPEKMFAEIYRILKPGGICYFAGRNKIVLVEAQYRLPFLSFMPKTIGSIYLHLFGKGNTAYDNTYKTYYGLKKMMKKFTITDYSIKILRNPEQFKFPEMKMLSPLAKLLPYQLFAPIIPNYIWILRKRK